MYINSVCISFSSVCTTINIIYELDETEREKNKERCCYFTKISSSIYFFKKQKRTSVHCAEEVEAATVFSVQKILVKKDLNEDNV